MGKIRVYKLADELEMESKELVNALQELGIEISSHMSTVEEETADLIRDMYSEDSEKSKEDIDIESKEEIVKIERKNLLCLVVSCNRSVDTQDWEIA